MPAKTAYHVDAQALAAILGIPRGRLAALVSAGMPVETRGSKARPWRFDLRQAIPWWGDFRERQGGEAAASLDPKQERARLDRVTADLREFELAKARGEYVPAADQDKVVIGLMTTVCGRLDMVPDQVGPRLSTERRPARCAEIVRDALYQAREDLVAEGRRAMERVEEEKP